MTPRERRAVLAGAAVMATAVIVLRIVPWTVRELAAARARGMQQARLLADTRAVVAGATALRDSLDSALRAVVALAPVLLEGRTLAEAGASLQSLLSGRATTSRLRIMRFDVSGDTAAPGARRVRAQLELEGDVRGLVRLLHDVETGTPLLTVEALSVLAPDPAPRAGMPETLRVVLEVGGWYFDGRSE